MRTVRMTTYAALAVLLLLALLSPATAGQWLQGDTPDIAGWWIRGGNDNDQVTLNSQMYTCPTLYVGKTMNFRIGDNTAATHTPSDQDQFQDPYPEPDHKIQCKWEVWKGGNLKYPTAPYPAGVCEIIDGAVNSGTTTFTFNPLEEDGRYSDNGDVSGNYHIKWKAWDYGRHNDNDISTAQDWPGPDSSPGGGEFKVTVTVDTVPPTGSIVIDGDAAYTIRHPATLTLYATDSGIGVADMRFKNEIGEWSSWETYATSKTWTLSEGDGLKTVYVQYRDSVLNESDVYSDTITLGAGGNVYYVKTLENGGDDYENDGTSWNQAFATVQKAIYEAQLPTSTRKTIWIAAGDYSPDPGQSYEINDVIRLYGGFPAAGGDTRDWYTNVTSLIGDYYSYADVISVGSGSTVDTMIDGFTIWGGMEGIGCYEYGGATISHNVITDNYDCGIFAYVASPMVCNNIIEFNYYGCGVFVVSSNGVDKPVIANNTIVYNWEGIDCYCDVLIANNIAMYNGWGWGWGYGIAANEADDIQNNCSYGNVDNYYPTVVPSSNISEDPLFDVDGLHLTECSACIDRGLNSAASSGQVDIDDDPRKIGPTVDIGADEFVYSGCRVATPYFSPGGGAYPSEIDVTITSDPGAVITYSLQELEEPLDPTEQGANIVPQSGIVHLSGWVVLKARAWVGHQPSCKKVATYNAGGPQQPYYVKTPENGGSDDDEQHDGKSWSQAFATIQHAIDKAELPESPRKAIWVAAGDYSPSGGYYLISDAIGLYGGFPAEGGNNRDWHTNVTSLIGNNSLPVVIIIGSTVETVIDGFTIRSGSDGVFLDECAAATISHNTITDNVECGVLAYYWSNPIITNNVINLNHYGCGIFLYCSNGVDEPVFTNNTISDNGYGGISVRGNVVVANNITANNVFGIYTQFAEDIQNNCSYGNYYFNYLPRQVSSDNLSLAPQLDEDGQHLTVYSPCIDRGLDSAVSEGQIDMDGDTRKIGAAVDIGADEYVYSGCRGPVVSFAPDGGVYSSDQDVTITSADPEAVITYTVDGTEPPSPSGPGAPSQIVNISGYKVLRAKSWLGSCQPGCKMATYYAGGPPYYVKTAENGGSDDEHDGTSWSQAFATVQHAIDMAAQPGSQRKEIWVAAGDYSPTTYLYFWIQDTVLLYGGFPAIGSGSSLDDRDWLANETRLIGAEYPPYATLVVTGGSTIGTVVDGFTIRGGFDGVDCFSFACATFSHNKIIENDACGIYTEWSTPIVFNNVITGSPGCGVFLYLSDYLNKPVISNNTISYSNYGGIDCWDAYCNVLIANNITVNNSYGIITPVADDIQNNCSYGNAIVDYWPIPYPSSNFSMDPLFDVDEWHLTDASPCIDQGLNSAAPEGEVDMEGDGRKFGPYVDIGADEHVYSGCRARMPSFDPDGGEYYSSLDVTITGESGDTITYSLDGSDPLSPEDEGVLVVPENGVVHIGSSCILSATAWNESCDPSSIRRAFYTIAIVIDMTASPAEIRACTGEESEIKAVVTDLETSQPVVDEPVIFHTTIGQFANETTEQTVNTDEEGMATVTFSQGTAAEGQTANITASLIGLPPGALVRVPIVSPAPYNVNAFATGKTPTNDLKITLYWDEVPNATGYNVYRGTISGGEDYENPLNGTTPVTTRTYDGSSKFTFTDSTGLSSNTEYFYTVKSITSCGESAASDEDSDIPDDRAIPWDSGDAYAVTIAVISLYGSSADLICALGPDGTVYSSMQGVLRPGGSVDLGTLEPDTNTLHYSDGSTLNLPDDEGILSGEDEEEESGIGLLMAIPTKQQNASDGPYRRVRSNSAYTGSYGVFYPGWRNQISMAKYDDPEHNIHVDDDYWTYLGSRTVTGSGLLEVDAGLQWSEVYYRYNPYLRVGSSLGKKKGTGPKARVLCPKNWPINFDTSYLGGIQMCYAMQPSGKGSVPMIMFDGADLNYNERTVLLAAANPVKVTSGMMKRAHSIAQGKTYQGKKANYYRLTGSHVYNAAFSDGELRNASGQWVTWTGSLTKDQGAYPWPSSIVTWTIPSEHEYYIENGISIQL